MVSTFAKADSIMDGHTCTHVGIRRVGSGASAAVGASATPTYVHRRLIGIIAMMALTTMTYKWIEPIGYDDGSPGSAKTMMNINVPNPTNIPNPNHYVSNRNLHNPPTTQLCKPSTSCKPEC